MFWASALRTASGHITNANEALVYLFPCILKTSRSAVRQHIVLFSIMLKYIEQRVHLRQLFQGGSMLHEVFMLNPPALLSPKVTCICMRKHNATHIELCLRNYSKHGLTHSTNVKVVVQSQRRHHIYNLIEEGQFWAMAICGAVAATFAQRNLSVLDCDVNGFHWQTGFIQNF